MQVDAWQRPHVGQRYPADDQHACDAAQECGQTVDFLWDAPQEEEAEHAAREDARECPPRVDDALDAQHDDGHAGAENAHAKTGEAHDGQLQLLVFVVVLWVVVAQAVSDAAGLEEEGTHVVGQDNRGGTGHRGRHRVHAGGEDAGNEQAAQAYGQPVDDEVGEDVVGLGLNLGRQRGHASLIVRVERAADEEEECRDRNKEIASEKCRELCILVRPLSHSSHPSPLHPVQGLFSAVPQFGHYPSSFACFSSL